MLAQIMQLSQGNPGAMTFLMSILEPQHLVDGLSIMPKIEECKIMGTDLYVLWSDLCDKDTSKVAELCRNTPNEVLIDACSRQDYSGRELVKEYFE